MKLKITALLMVLILCLGMLAGCGKDNADAKDGKIDAKVILVLEDESEVPYDLHVTSGSTLRDALYEAELIDEDTYYAMFVENIDGHIADVMNDGCTWMIADTNGEQIPGSFDEVIVEDGQTIKLVYYVVPDFD